jgi:LSD1 subclass zinc finger protein
MSDINELRPEIISRTAYMRKTEYLGKTAWVDGKGRIFMVCAGCRRLVQVNKFLLGSLHICDES